MKYIVTGGAGFIGSHIVDRLVSLKKEVIVIDDLTTGDVNNLVQIQDKIKFIKGSILDPDLFDRTIQKNDIIFHQAAVPSVQRSIENPYLTNKVNIEGTLTLLLAAKKKQVKRVIFSSSSSVYGDSETLPKRENMCSNPKSPYALSKLAGEEYMKQFYRLYGLETVILRYFNVFGPNQNPNTENSAVIPKFIKCMLTNNIPVIFGDGRQSRDFTFVSNVVDANILASESRDVAGEIFNIASGQRISLLDLVKKLNNLFKKELTPHHKEERKGDVKHSLADISKARMIGYTPKITFEDGLKKTIEFYR